MEGKQTSAVRDALVSAVAAMVVAGVALTLWAYKVYWAFGLLSVGVVVFLGVLYFHPSRFYKRVVWACLGLIPLFGAVPALRAAGVFAEDSAFVVMVDSIGTGGFVALCLLCGVALIVCAVMEYVRTRNAGAQDGASPGQDGRGETLGAKFEQRVAPPERSPSVGYAERVEIHYGAEERPIEEGKAPEPGPEGEPGAGPGWPGVWVPLGGPKVSVPFAGRAEELKRLAEAMSGDGRVVAVVGMAGQGKSCLVGEWYQSGARPPEGVGLLWRKVYEPGYTFDRFLDELHVYLTGAPFDRQALRTVEERAAVVVDLLRCKPCWIVLDGVERWLNRWAAEPDAGADDATVDDRAGREPVLDKFLAGAIFWHDDARLLLTTRAVPSALDERSPVLVGRKTKGQSRLEALKRKDAVALLRDLDATAKADEMREAVEAYGCHPYAVHVLGGLIRDLYGGDVARWRELNPLEGNELAGLFERIIEHRPEDLELLERLACSVGPPPVEMLADLSRQDDAAVRNKLARLAKWQMAEFEGAKGEAEQHTVVRQFLLARMEAERAIETRKQLADWWSQREVPANPTGLEQVRPLLRAVDHLVAARDPDAAACIFLRKPAAESHYTVDEWLWRFGYLDEDVRINGELIDAYVVVIEQDGRRELRNDLASCYNNRGIALAAQGRLSEAVADYARAIQVYEALVTQERRLELRNDLARCYNNRGTALSDQGKLAEAVADYARAIEIRDRLVREEDRRELRNDLARCYNNRGTALRDLGKSAEAVTDYDRAIEIRERLVTQEGRLELRNDLAACYNNRGVSLRAQGKLAEAIAEYGRAIEIRETLVMQEDRRELRNDLAGSYNNRGAALWNLGRPAEAAADYKRAIEIYEALVTQEGRRELRSDFGRALFNRALARGESEEWKQARADIEQGAALLQEVIQEGQRHVVASYLQTVGSRCRRAEEFGDVATAARWANDAMRLFVEEVEAKRTNELLLRAAGKFAHGVATSQGILAKEGLDEALLARFRKLLDELK